MPDEREIKVKISVDVTQAEKISKVKKALSSLGSDVDQTAKTAREFSKNWGVSFRDAYSAVTKFGVGGKELTRISHDSSELGKTARVFAKDWGVSLEDARNYMGALGVSSRKVSQALSVDLKSGDKFAQDFSKSWGISIESARDYINKLGLQTKKTAGVIHHDVDVVAKTARTFARDWGVSFKDAHAYMERLGVGTKKTSGSIAYNLTFIAWHFRYLGNIFRQFSQQWLRLTKDWIQNAADIEEATFGIRVATSLFGRDSEQALSIVDKLVETGLIKYKDAAEAVRNLTLTGLGMPELEKVMGSLLNLSTIFTIAGKDLGDSINKVSQATLIGTGLMRSDLLMRVLLDNMNKKAKETYDRMWTSMSKLERSQFLYNEALKLSTRTGEIWKGEANLMAGQIYKLQTNIQLTKAALGEALRPVLDLVSDLMAKLRTIIEGLSRRMGGLLSTITILGVAFTTVFASFAFGMGVVLSFIKIWKGLQAEIVVTSGLLKILTLSHWQIFLVLTAVAAAITGITYLYLRATGRLDKFKDSMNASAKAIKGVKEQFEALGGAEEAMADLIGESEEVSEKERIAHERRTEDIMEDLERERSKGLWANQMTIKDLEKRLRREEEDWALLQKEKGAMAAADMKETKEKSKWEIMTQAEKLKQIIDDTKDAIKQLDEIYTPWYEKIGKKITELPPIWQAALAGIATAILAYGIPALIKLSNSIGALGPIATAAFAKIGVAFAGLRTTLSTPISLIILVSAAMLAISAVLKHFKLVNLAITDQQRAIHEAGQYWDEYMRKQLEFYRQGQISWKEYQEAYEMAIEAQEAIRETLITPTGGRSLWEMIKSIPEAWREALGYQFGGIVPGLRNQPVPIIAHGGERVIPAGEVTGGGITININNPIVREQEDINRIARAVSQALGQRQRFARLGGF